MLLTDVHQTDMSPVMQAYFGGTQPTDEHFLIHKSFIFLSIQLTTETSEHVHTLDTDVCMHVCRSHVFQITHLQMLTICHR